MNMTGPGRQKWERKCPGSRGNTQMCSDLFQTKRERFWQLRIFRIGRSYFLYPQYSTAGTCPVAVISSWSRRNKQHLYTGVRFDSPRSTIKTSSIHNRCFFDVPSEQQEEWQWTKQFTSRWQLDYTLHLCQIILYFCLFLFSHFSLSYMRKMLL